MLNKTAFFSTLNQTPNPHAKLNYNKEIQINWRYNKVNETKNSRLKKKLQKHPKKKNKNKILRSETLEIQPELKKKKKKKNSRR